MDARLICLGILVVSAGYVILLRRDVAPGQIRPSCSALWGLMTLLPIIGVPRFSRRRRRSASFSLRSSPSGCRCFCFAGNGFGGVRETALTSTAFLSSGKAVALFAGLQLIPLAAMVLNVRYQGFSLYTLFMIPFRWAVNI